MSRRLLAGWRRLAALALCLAVATAQDPQPTRPATRPATDRQNPEQALEGVEVRRIVVTPPEAQTAGVIVTKLKTQVGRPFRRAVMAEDLAALWSTLKVRAWYEAELTPEGVQIRIDIRDEFKSYDRILFRGLEHFTEEDVRTSLGISAAQRMNNLMADAHARALATRYRREGYYFVRITIEREDAASTLTFHVDEGPRVTVREIHFRGNREFPSWAVLQRNLTSTPGIESEPEGKILKGAAYSEDVVEEDLDRLRLFYRGIGFRDARVELVDRQFVENHHKVDLTFRVIEGQRYRIASIDIEQRSWTPAPDYKPLYPREEVLKVLRVKPGDYYDRERIMVDRAAIERYYGERGHPRRSSYGGKLLEALDVPEPKEVFDVANATIQLTYTIVEGTPKRLRQVTISGNRQTQDRVIRRRLTLQPGDLLDSNKLVFSQNRLEDLSYFGGEQDLRGVRFELTPVEGKPDEADLHIIVSEGETGHFQWGGGISNDGGLNLLLSFTKRNFDITRPPSSFNPVTIVDEIIRGEAFHGAGQTLDLRLQPGTEWTSASLTLVDPDIFRRHVDTIGLRVQGYRSLRRLDGYLDDTTGAAFNLERNFTPSFSVGAGFRIDSTEVDDIDANAPTVVYDARGQTEIRSLNLNVNWSWLNQRRRPSEGYDVRFTSEVAGGLLGAEEDFYKFGLSGDYYWPFYRDSLDRPHVLRTFSRFDYGHEYGDSDDLFLTERFYMGGGNLRAFSQRGAGPSQFDRPVGGTIRFLSTLEYLFPLVSTRLDNDVRETEFLRGVLFADLGMLGLSADDPTFSEPRLGIGFGLRIHVPQLQLPIAVDFGYPLLYEETDSRRALYFSLMR